MAEAVAAAGHGVDGFLVQRMVGDGVEMLVGVVHDPSFGPVIACGAGGDRGRAAQGRGGAHHPADRPGRAPRWSARWRPSRCWTASAAPPRPTWPRWRTLLLRVSALVEAHPEIAELDCNPVKVLPDGAVVVDARVRVEAASPLLPLAARRR